MTPQKAPIPAPKIPFGYVGPWPSPSQPLAPQYGTKLISPPIEVTADNWKGPQSDAFPQIATDTGQVFDDLYYEYNTYMGPAGLPPGDPSWGFLANPETQAWPPSALRGVSGMGAFTDRQVMTPNNWSQPLNNPVKAAAPPSQTVTVVRQQIDSAVKTFQNQVDTILKQHNL